MISIIPDDGGELIGQAWGGRVSSGYVVYTAIAFNSKGILGGIRRSWWLVIRERRFGT
jgi:hypothetical protein